MKWLAGCALALCCFLLSAAAHPDASLVAQLAKDHVDITTHFTGEDILIFGALPRAGDVVIKVVSPSQDVAISRKVKMGPVWLDSGKVVLKDTPGLMYLLSARPIEQLLPPQEIERHGLDLKEGLSRGVLAGTGESVPGWQDAFLRLKAEKGYYQRLSDAVTIVNNRLFFTRLTLPAKLPIGQYKLDIYLIEDGHVVSKQSSQLDVRQVRLEYWASNIAHKFPWIYGVAFTLVVMLIGLALGIVLRRNQDD